MKHHDDDASDDDDDDGKKNMTMMMMMMMMMLLITMRRLTLPSTLHVTLTFMILMTHELSILQNKNKNLQCLLPKTGCP